MKLKTTQTVKDCLARQDERLDKLIKKYGDIEIELAENYFESLASSIVGQQLSNKIAAVIWDRLIKLPGCDAAGTPGTIKSPSDYKQSESVQISPELIAARPVEDLRAVGLSYNKIAYLKNLSDAVLSGSVKLDSLQSLENDEIITMLTKIKGIGKWTAEMFLIFSLGRQDVFSLGDGGLFNAIKKLYEADELTKNDCKALTDKWSPYRTFASLYLWKSLDNE